MSTSRSYFTVDIPTKPYLQQYFASRFGHPYIVVNTNLFGSIVVSLLQKKNFHVSLKPGEKENIRESFTQIITCMIPVSMMKDYGGGLKTDHFIQINRFLDNMFEEDLHLFVHHRLDDGKRYSGFKQAIEKFTDQYQLVIDDHISFEALKKIEYRYRQRKQEKKNPNKFFEELSSRKVHSVQPLLFASFQ